MTSTDHASDRVDHPHPGWWISVFFGMTLLGVLALHDAGYALWARHVTTLFTPVLLRWLFAVAVALHAGEAAYALLRARRASLSTAATIGWTLQTLALGYPSLRLLLRRR